MNFLTVSWATWLDIAYDNSIMAAWCIEGKLYWDSSYTITGHRLDFDAINTVEAEIINYKILLLLKKEMTSIR